MCGVGNSRSHATNANARGRAALSSSVVPKRPGALALMPNGALLVADEGRDQILEWQHGRFSVVAGTAKTGFTGDGGQARQAEINDPAGMAIGRDGSVYFADSGNSRIREISKTTTRPITVHERDT